MQKRCGEDLVIPTTAALPVTAELNRTESPQIPERHTMINREAISHVANLAKLELTDAELNLYSEQLAAIIQHFEQLSGVNTENIQPLMTPSEIVQHFREDAVHASKIREEIFANAPEKSGFLFKVPPVV
jgi:aspartyl-tRNA(Asn)/glutamyl-tRNA(Gln) amidotransferase subunit C